MPDQRGLREFVAVVENRGFTAAAAAAVKPRFSTTAPNSRSPRWSGIVAIQQ